MKLSVYPNQKLFLYYCGQADWNDVDFIQDTSPSVEDWLKWKVFCQSENLTSCQFGSKYYTSGGSLARIYGTNGWQLDTGDIMTC